MASPAGDDLVVAVERALPRGRVSEAAHVGREGLEVRGHRPLLKVGEGHAEVQQEGRKTAVVLVQRRPSEERTVVGQVAVQGRQLVEQCARLHPRNARNG